MNVFYRHDLCKDFFWSISLHVLVLGGVLFTFPSPQFPVKPHLVFLGSFLGEQDLTYSLRANSLRQNDWEDQAINMDVRRDAYTHSVTKPEQKNLVKTSDRLQYKPTTVSDFSMQKKKNEISEFAPIFETDMPIRMKLIGDDKN